MKRLLFIALMGSALLTSCLKNNCVKANGYRDHYGVSVDQFWGIHVDGSANVVVEYGPEYSASILTAPNVKDLYELEVVDGILQVGPKSGVCVRGVETTIYLTTPSLHWVSISGSGEVIMSDFEEVTMSYAISGSGEILSNNCSVEDLFISISGSGDVDAIQSVASNATIDISGSGDVDLKVTDLLDVDITGSGDVRYIGNPTVNQRITGSGSVTPF